MRPFPGVNGGETPSTPAVECWSGWVGEKLSGKLNVIGNLGLLWETPDG